MRLVMTMMVRDESDIVAAMIEHHLDQGIDLLIVTDNGSNDGTTEILERYAALGVIELHHDPVHRKQQGIVVTGMARRAFTDHGADWVVNADADEFLVPIDRSLTVREALERTPVTLQAFTVPVVNLVGPPARRGAGIKRLVWRDHRSDEELTAIGIHAQPTPNAIHVGDPDVRVSEGNHFVTLESRGQPDPAVAMEVLHLPWRSWSQFEKKVLNTGSAFEASPNLKPSPKHHGMSDYRRAHAGWLHEAWHLRLPQDTDLATSDRFDKDDWLCRSLHDLVPRARLPGLLEEALDDTADQSYSAAERAALAGTGAKFLALELELNACRTEVGELRSTVTTLRQHRSAQRRRARELRATVRRLRTRVRRLREERNQARRQLAQATRWVPVRTDLARVGRRVTGAVRRRITG